MAGQSVWYGALKADGTSVPDMARWRDTTLTGSLATLPALLRIDHYTAFNLPAAMVVAAFDTQEAPKPQIGGKAGVTLSHLRATMKSEFRQPGLADPISAPILYSVLFTVPQDWQQEFDDWYDQEHVPMILGCEYWGMTRRYRVSPDPHPRWTHLALHYVLDAKAFDSNALKAARTTPWRDKFLKQDWFTNADKMICFRQTIDTAARPRETANAGTTR